MSGPEHSVKLLYRVAEAAAILSMSRSKVYELMREGRLRFIKVDGSTRIPYSALEEFVAAREEEQQQLAGV